MDRLARALSVAAAEDDSRTAAHAARAWLETRASARTLVVFDNVPDPTVVQQWLPAVGHARIIITSTNRTCEDLGTAVRVETFTVAEAAAFLSTRTGLPDNPSAHELAGEVGYLPLALGQAAAAIRSQRLNYGTMLHRIRSLPMDQYLRRQVSDPYPRGAAQAVLLAVRQVEEFQPLASTLTGLIAVLSPAGIRREIPHALIEPDDRSRLARAERDAVSVADIDSALGRLAEASLLTFTLDGDAVLMHRFTQRVLRDRADHAGLLPDLIVRAAQLIRSCRPNPRSAVPSGEKWVTQRGLGQHLMTQIDALWEVTDSYVVSGTAASHGRSFGEAQDLILMLRRWSIHYLWDINDPGRAIEIGETVVADHEHILGDDCEVTMDSRAGLALAYGMQRRHDEAIALHERIVAWYASNKGPDDPVTLNLRNTLANNYLESAEDFAQPARLATAVALHERNRSGWLSVGAAARDQSSARFFTDSNLARVYAKIGRIDEAVKLAEENVLATEHKFGGMHHMTLGALSTRAEVYASGGRLDEAVTTSRSTVQQALTMWGEGNPLTLYYRQQHADFLSRDGDPRTAISELEDVIALLEQLLGENNPRTCRALETLSEAYRKAYDIPAAIRTHEKILQVCLNTVGDSSPLTARIRAQIVDLQAGSNMKKP